MAADGWTGLLFTDRVVCVAIRPVISCLLGLAVLLGSSIGLTRGVVLHVDEEGHLVLESAHVLHAQAHEEDGHHHDHESPLDADHAEWHIAMAGDHSARLDRVADRPTDDHCVGVAGGQVTGFAMEQWGAIQQSPRLGAAGTLASIFWGSTARVARACLGATVLLN